MRAFFIIAILFVSTGCSQTAPPSPPSQTIVSEDENTPEGVYRRFMIANLSGDEATIRPLIVNNEDADVLWQGAYPVDVAAALAQQYRGIEISRIESSGTDRVLLQSSASPIPLAAVNVEGTWRIDAGPIIDFRKASKGTQ